MPATRTAETQAPAAWVNRPGADHADIPGVCWLIDGGTAGEQSSAEQFAQLRGMNVQHYRTAESIPGAVQRPTMIAIPASLMCALSAETKRHLASLVEGGAILYVRGLPGPGVPLDLVPFEASNAAIAAKCDAFGYRFTASQMLPAALAREEAARPTFEAYGAEHLPARAEVLLALRHADGKERAAIFALSHGDGCAIFDLHSNDGDGEETPLVERLAVPQTRNMAAGALIAVDRAIRKEGRPLPPFNLTIDDRPVNFDRLNTAPVGALLRHIEEVCPGAHTDFGWTPRHATPSRGYLEVMKSFPTGFVWHGLFRHVDHRAIADTCAEFAKGRRMVSEIEERFGVRLQPIMIFPFERSGTEHFRLLQEAGFIACVQQPHAPRGLASTQPRYLQYSLPSETSCGFTVLYRYQVETLTGDRMLAMAALGLPIIAYAHPDQLGLRRLSRLWDRKGQISHFDAVLKFAVAKGLPSRSLEAIATGVKAESAARPL